MKIIDLDRLGIYNRVPNNMHDLVDGKEVTKLEEILSRRTVQLRKIKNELCIVMNGIVIAKLCVKVDSKRKKFVAMIE